MVMLTEFELIKAGVELAEDIAADGGTPTLWDGAQLAEQLYKSPMDQKVAREWIVMGVQMWLDKN